MAGILKGAKMSSSQCHRPMISKRREPNPRNRLFTPGSHALLRSHRNKETRRGWGREKDNLQMIRRCPRDVGWVYAKWEEVGAVISVQIAKLRRHCAVIARSELSRSFSTFMTPVDLRFIYATNSSL